MSEVSKITAQLHVSMMFNCPKCDDYLDLFDIDWMNDEGQLWSLINAKYKYDENPWENLSQDGDEFECPKCKQLLSLDKLEY